MIVLLLTFCVRQTHNWLCVDILSNSLIKFCLLSIDKRDRNNSILTVFLLLRYKSDMFT